MPYVDGFVLPVPKKKLAAYQKMAKKAGKIWMEHGAVEFRECAGDDLKTGMGIPFARTVKAKPTETILFSYIVFKNKAHRNAVNKKVMSDPRLENMMAEKDMPFDVKRMAYGGFKTIVDL